MVNYNAFYYEYYFKIETPTKRWHVNGYLERKETNL